MSDKWRKENREKYLAGVATWKKENPEKVKANNKRWRDRHRVQIAAYNKANRKNFRRYNLVSRYGLAIEGYNDLFSEQDGKCAICGIHQTELKKSLHIDHCHKTNKIRGLLCSNCNAAIGLFQDDIENMKCAILYLNK